MPSVRNDVTYTAVGVASGATTVETVITLTKASGTGANSSASSFVIPTGKAFAITGITFGSRGHNKATAQITTFSFRLNQGAVTTSSTPKIFNVRTTNGATDNAVDRINIPLSDPYIIYGDGTLQFGITANAVFTTNAPTWDVLITGYEY